MPFYYDLFREVTTNGSADTLSSHFRLLSIANQLPVRLVGLYGNAREFLTRESGMKRSHSLRFVEVFKSIAIVAISYKSVKTLFKLLHSQFLTVLFANGIYGSQGERAFVHRPSASTQ